MNGIFHTDLIAVPGMCIELFQLLQHQQRRTGDRGLQRKNSSIDRIMDYDEEEFWMM